MVEVLGEFGVLVLRFGIADFSHGQEGVKLGLEGKLMIQLFIKGGITKGRAPLGKHYYYT